MYEYGKGYIMGQMKKQGELNSASESSLHREKKDSKLIGGTDQGALQVNMPRQPDPKNKVDPAVFRMADEKNY
ncbi:uncharacterized protein METZ01_LOCUS321919 [marine metagenome]|uniref:Uncharacterized protein n=1 Tax=marine metagenome TaxID=408172 RepID=A0A382P8X8_9ZZZZ